MKYPHSHKTIDERFAEFHVARPEVYRLFKMFATEVLRAGHKRYSADAILHRIRWHYHVERKDGEDFKINDHYSSRYARLLVADMPQAFKDFFELRQITAGRQQEAA